MPEQRPTPSRRGGRARRAAALAGAAALGAVLATGCSAAAGSGAAGGAGTAGAAPANATAASALPPSVPDRIEIPDLKVDAPLDTVGLDAQGHGSARLRLITCGGNLTADRHWDSNVVVYAHLTGRA
ncbi:hypothetical protein AB0D97_01850 [Streptomyces roseus]|uniref:hypothetical protein n=1 Tax=Streptomyces roseus TaxID=66430 RepID=UPI0033F7B3BF